MNASTKKCPFCGEQIREEAVKCRFCGEWLEAMAPTPEPKPAGYSTPADVRDGPSAMNQQIQTAAETPAPATPTAETDESDSRHDPWTNYWYRILYMMLCLYLAYCAAMHLLGAVLGLSSESNVDVPGTVTTILLQTGLLAFLGYAIYTLSQRRVKMGMVYALGLLSVIGVVFGTPGCFLLWVPLCAMPFFGFLHEKKTEELLKKATEMETDGKIQEALGAYRKAADSHTAVARDARKALETLELRGKRDR